MPKNMGKGGKNRKRGTNKNESVKRSLITAESVAEEIRLNTVEDVAQEGKEGEKKEKEKIAVVYASVTRMLGNGYLELLCSDGHMRIGRIPGSMRRKVWMTVGDTVLASVRSFQQERADIIHKYLPEEVKDLIKDGHLSDKAFVRDDRQQSRNIEWVIDEKKDDEDEKNHSDASNGSDEDEGEEVAPQRWDKQAEMLLQHDAPPAARPSPPKAQTTAGKKVNFLEPAEHQGKVDIDDI